MNKIKKLGKSIYLPFIIFGLILICIHFPIQKYNDDLWFQNILNNQGMLDYLESRHHTWSSRIIIEAVLIAVSNTHVDLILWKIINILMFELLAYSTFKIFIKEIKDKDIKLKLVWILIFGLLTIPLTMLKDAGWIATTTNYLWTLSLGMFIFTLLKKSLDEEKIKWYNSILYIIATIYAANQEQMSAVLIAIFTLYILYLIKNKQLKEKLNRTTILVYILVVLSLIYILICPGNDLRNIQETKTWYPEYEYMGFLSKVQLGFTSMMKYLVIDGKIVFILLTAVMAYYIFKEYKNTLCKIIGVIPVIGATFLNVFGSFTTKLLPGLNNMMNIYSNNQLIINQTNMTDLSIYIPMLIYVLILFCILINICLIFKNTDTCKLVIVIYGLGLATRLIMGFSPTVFASCERPSLFLYFSFIVISLLILKKLLQNNKNISNIQTVYIIIATLNLINGVAL